MSQHFLLSRAAKTLTLPPASSDEAEEQTTMPVHHLPSIVDVLQYIDVAGASGEKLLTLLDEHGERVTLRLQDIGARRLLKRMEAEANQAP
jgi:hypothetical protein